MFMQCKRVIATGACALAMTGVTRAHAATFVVDTTDDTVDANPGDGICADSNGNCSLRAAIMEANQLDGPDVITLPDGLYRLTIPGAGEAAGDLVVLDDLTINGESQANTVIDANGIDRALDIQVAPDVHLSHLSIVNGVTGASGGGILSRGGALSLDHVSVRSCFATLGGGIFNEDGSLSMLSSEVVLNVAADNGGGLWTRGIAVLDDCDVRDNEANQASGGGIYQHWGILTLRNGCQITLNVGLVGGGVYSLAGSIVATESHISFNEAGSGAGVFCQGATLDATECSFTGNQASSGGGAFLGDQGGFAWFTQCGFDLNEGNVGGAILVDDMNVSLEWCTFVSNTSTSSGGAMYISSPIVTANWCIFDANDAGSNGGAVYVNSGGLIAEDCMFMSNQGNGGGVAYLASATGHFERCDFIDNVSNGRGGVFEQSGFSLTVKHSLFEGNSADDDGGAIYAAEFFLSLEHCDFVDNLTGGDGGAIYNDCGAEAFQCTFQSNNASGDGGAVYQHDASFNLVDCDFEENTADYGGAVFHDDYSMALTRCTFIDNGVVSNGQGGAIYSKSDGLGGTECSFHGNTAYDGGAVWGDGETSFFATTFALNIAGNEGGAVANEGQFTCVNCTMSGNVGFRGGAFYNEEEATFLNCTIAFNSAEQNLLSQLPKEPTLGLVKGITMTPAGPFADGGGFFNSGGTLVFANTILADNEEANCAGQGSVSSLGYNIDTDGSCALAGPGDLANVPALLGPLADNGGLVLTHALLAGSLAIDSADGFIAPPTDARGEIRPRDGDGDGAAQADRGAFETDTVEPEEPSSFGIATDECIDANLICPGMAGQGNNIGATGTPFFCGSQFGVLDVWVRYDPLSSGAASVSVQGPPLTWIYQVWRGCPGMGGVLVGCGISPGAATFSATGGQSYYVRIAGTGFGEGTFQVSVSGPACN